ncbi:glycosyl hydrolase family 28-related protein [Coraliomargarita parva]|uniref:glycosyl hydrolase family 28-related protein n=1 Tax=Coraliomargarita parva TaxID=3014050 RepID=UPI0022B3C55B|nr:glycosyl hydrolase family 28-related protein [Coraliomargarita parva]
MQKLQHFSASLLSLLLAACGNSVKTTTPAETTQPAVENVYRLNVQDLGALGDGKHDDAAAFESALNQLRAIEGPKELIVPTGTYYLKPTEGSSAHISITKQKDLTLKAGKGTLFVMGSPFHDGVYVGQSENVNLESFAIDYQPLPFTQGTIVEADPKSHAYVLEIDEGYPLVSDPQIDADHTKNILYIYKDDTTIKDNSFYDQYIVKMEQLGDHRAKLKSRNPVTDAFVGKRAVLVGRRKANAVTYDKSKGGTLYQISVHASPALAYLLRSSSNITLRECNIIQKPGTNRILSSIADGLHVKWGHIGPKVYDCHFEGMGDDSMNVGGTYQRIYDQPDPRTLIVEAHGSLATGKNIKWVVYETGEVIDLPECSGLRTMRYNGKAAMQLSFSEDLKRIGPMLKNTDFDHCDLVINYDQVAMNPIIKGNFFGRHRMRGIMLHAPGAIVEDNHFENLNGGINVGHHYHGRKEGPNGAGAIIRNNSFSYVQSVNISLNDSGPPAATEARRSSIKDIEITGNQFDNYGEPTAHSGRDFGSVISVNTADNVLVKDNVIGVPNPKAPSDVARIKIGEAMNVKLENNMFSATALQNGTEYGFSEEADMTSIEKDD